MDAATTTYKVHQCSNCLGDTEYFCQSCLCDLCSQCSENHETDLKTKDHNVVFYHEDLSYIPNNIVRVIQTGSVLDKRRINHRENWKSTVNDVKFLSVSIAKYIEHTDT